MDLLVGESDWSNRIREDIERVGPTTSTVLITGPTGTGKELIARSVHQSSPRKEKSFVTVDCASIPSSLVASQLFGHVKGAYTGADYGSIGFFRAADGGTIFLDEIGELQADAQAHLLRVLQERVIVPVGSQKPVPIDVRIVAATNRDLAEEVRKGRFRQDLFYRLNVVPLETVALADRRDDIPLLADYFLARQWIDTGMPLKRLSDGARALMAEHDWPGNVRQIQNILERAAVFTDGPEIDAGILASYLGQRHVVESMPPRFEIKMHPESAEQWPTFEQFEDDLIRRTLERTGNNRTAAAQLLGIDYRRLNRMMQKYGQSVPDKSSRSTIEA
ncbi:MAG: hypothetical protein CMJ18_05005 [Phycisphaeraceae bacterium]|nr:hypothetical protein [Phycisphaeraceae bacterium]